MPSCRWPARLLITLLLVGSFNRPASALPLEDKIQPKKDDIPALIDKLKDIADGDVGFIPTMTGSGFLPLGVSSPGALLLGQQAPVSSDTMRELVKRGAAAVPHLIAHLDDRRPTKITIKHEGFLGGIFFNDEYDYNRQTTKMRPEGVNRDLKVDEKHPNTHTVTVGDLCFVALGQIVNRNFNAVRYQPTTCIMINSPTYSEALRKAIKKEWGELTPDKHKELLSRDFTKPDYEDRRTGACLRLGYYYPDTLEPLAVKQLAAPRYDVFEVEKLIREKLYPVKDPKERKALLDALVAQRGQVARDGVLIYLFDDLSTQEADEERRLYPPLTDKYAARACLVELFGYPKKVKSINRPYLHPDENCTQARFIDTLALFPAPKLDAAVRDVMRSTDDDYLAQACARFLVGRGADADIRQYVERRMKGADKEQREQLQHLLDQVGWTPLHVAADAGAEDRIDDLIRKGADVSARADNGQTPLHVAAAGHFGAIRALLKHKANPNIKDRQGKTPVQLAMGFESAVNDLLAAGADIPDILVASFAGRAELVKSFLEKDKTTVGARTFGGETPLHLAALYGHLKVAEVLLRHGADINANDGKSKLTPLHWAANYGHRELVSLLLAHKADRSAKSWDDKTPLDFAREKQDEVIIRLLEKDP